MKYNNSMIENKFEYNATLICFFFWATLICLLEKVYHINHYIFIKFHNDGYDLWSFATHQNILENKIERKIKTWKRKSKPWWLLTCLLWNRWLHNSCDSCECP